MKVYHTLYPVKNKDGIPIGLYGRVNEFIL